MTTNPTQLLAVVGARPSRWAVALQCQAFAPARLEAVGSGGVFAIPGFDEVVDDVVDAMTRRGPMQINKATARLRLRTWLKDQNYVPDAPGSQSDLTTDTRLNLILETQARMRRGQAQYDQGMSRVAVAMYPCWEFTRVETRKEPREWPEVWAEAGGQFYPGPSSYPEGKMVARKDSSIWTAISRFGNPWPPFDFNSGMGLRQVERDWCVRHKLVRPDEFDLKEAA